MDAKNTASMHVYVWITSIYSLNTTSYLIFIYRSGDGGEPQIDRLLNSQKQNFILLHYKTINNNNNNMQIDKGKNVCPS